MDRKLIHNMDRRSTSDIPTIITPHTGRVKENTVPSSGWHKYDNPSNSARTPQRPPKPLYSVKDYEKMDERGHDYLNQLVNRYITPRQEKQQAEIAVMETVGQEDKLTPGLKKWIEVKKKHMDEEVKVLQTGNELTTLKKLEISANKVGCVGLCRGVSWVWSSVVSVYYR